MAFTTIAAFSEVLYGDFTISCQIFHLYAVNAKETVELGDSRQWQTGESYGNCGLVINVLPRIWRRVRNVGAQTDFCKIAWMNSIYTVYNAPSVEDCNKLFLTDKLSLELVWKCLFVALRWSVLLANTTGVR